MIKGPKNISECTLIHIEESYLKLIDVKEEPVSFDGTLVELLEKFKTNDDVQIFFFSDVRGNETMDFSVKFVIKSVLGTLLHTYNK